MLLPGSKTFPAWVIPGKHSGAANRNMGYQALLGMEWEAVLQEFYRNGIGHRWNKGRLSKVMKGRITNASSSRSL